MESAPVLWIDRINSMIAILPKAIFRLNATPPRPNIILYRNWKINLKIHMEAEKILGRQNNLDQ